MDLVLPAVLLVGALGLWPTLQIVAMSLTIPEFGFGNYADVLSRPLVHRVWLTTLRICLTTTVLTVILGYVVAYGMVVAGRTQRSLLMTGVLLTFWLSVLVRSFALVVLFRNEGLANEALLGLGLIDQPLQLVRNETGVLIGMVHVLLPYAILPIYSQLSGIDPRLMDAASSLGARRRQSFLLVFLPLSLPGIVLGATLVFIFALGFFITPAIMGGGRGVMITEYIRVSFEETLQWGVAATLSTSLLLSVIGSLIVVSRFVKLNRLFGDLA